MDILFLAAIAIYIFFKLREQFGKIEEEQKRDAIKKFIKEQSNSNQNPSENKQEVLPISSKESEIKSNQIINEVDIAVRQNFVEVLQRTKMSAEEFLGGAIKAFEMIIEAFASGNYKTLKLLLSEKLFLNFEKAIKDKQNAGQFLNTRIVAITESKIIAAKIIENYAAITIKFTSKQINYVTNASGEVVEGSKEEVNLMEDVWTFKKDLNVSDPNWFVSATN